MGVGSDQDACGSGTSGTGDCFLQKWDGIGCFVVRNQHKPETGKREDIVRLYGQCATLLADGFVIMTGLNQYPGHVVARNTDRVQGPGSLNRAYCFIVTSLAHHL